MTTETAPAADLVAEALALADAIDMTVPTERPSAARLLRRLAAALSQAQAEAGGYKVALDEMFKWLDENGIECDVSKPVPVMRNTRLAAAEADNARLREALEAIKDHKHGEPQTIEDWHDYPQIAFDNVRQIADAALHPEAQQSK